MRIVFDLDGVLRDINLYLNRKYAVPYPQEWFWKYQDKDIFEWIAGDEYQGLVYAPVTEYLQLVSKRVSQIELWTCQPDNWKRYTDLWINANIGKCVVHYLNTEQKRAQLDKEPDTYLVEDCPNFTNYDRIILIDRPYNRSVKAEIRVKTPSELLPWLNIDRCPMR